MAHLKYSFFFSKEIFTKIAKYFSEIAYVQKACFRRKHYVTFLKKSRSSIFNSSTSIPFFLPFSKIIRPRCFHAYMRNNGKIVFHFDIYSFVVTCVVYIYVSRSPSPIMVIMVGCDCTSERFIEQPIKRELKRGAASLKITSPRVTPQSYGTTGRKRSFRRVGRVSRATTYPGTGKKKR